MPTYPTPNPEVTIVKNGLLALLRNIAYLDPTHGGTLEAVNDPKLVLEWKSYTPPTMVLAFAGAVLRGDPTTKAQDAGVFEEWWHWSIFVIAGNYDITGAGVGDLYPGDPGVEAMISDVRAATYGRTVLLTPHIVKAFPASPSIAPMPLDRERVVYRLGLRTNWLVNTPIP